MPEIDQKWPKESDIWANPGQIRSISANSGQIWDSRANVRPINGAPHMRFGLKLGQNWPNLAKFDPAWARIYQFWPKLGDNLFEMTTIDQDWPKESDFWANPGLFRWFFGQFCAIVRPNLIMRFGLKLCQNWPDLAKFDRKWTRIYQCWPKSVRNDGNWPKLTERIGCSGKSWPNPVNFGQFWPNLRFAR